MAEAHHAIIQGQKLAATEQDTQGELGSFEQIIDCIYVYIYIYIRMVSIDLSTCRTYICMCV